jgi:hypothetical protein
MRRDLVEAARHGDHEAFEVLATSAGDRLYAVARLILRESDLAPGSIAWWSTPVQTRTGNCGAGRTRGDRSRWTPPSAMAPVPLPTGNSWSGDDRRFTECDEGNLKSWVAPMDTADEGDAFCGYTGPGYVEEFWILDVEGTRLIPGPDQVRGTFDISVRAQSVSKAPR